MLRVLRRFAPFVAVLLGCANAYAQSAPHPANHEQATDVFAGVHQALDRSVNTLLTEPARETAKSDETGEAIALNSSSPASREKAFADVAGARTSAQRRLEQLRPLLDPILQREGIPPGIAFVVVVESASRADALSPKGARGLWQLMPETARRYGLVVEPERDERLDVEKSTQAAARYLRDLHRQFASWPTALAAYNAGEQAVQRAIERTGNGEFTVLASSELLPPETRAYVPAVINLMVGSGNLSGAIGQATQRPRDPQIVYAVRTTEGPESVGASERK